MSVESQRFRLQVELDAKKSLKDRNKLGQYSTPYNLALDICQCVKPFIGDEIESFLEPAIGTGVFYSALRDIVRIKKCIGFEIDTHYFTPSAKLWENYNIELRNEDFLTATPEEKVSLIISNPPYTRHHLIPHDIKQFLCDQVRQIYDINISGLSGLYAYFLILSTQWLRPNGISCWLIPSEFLSVNFGHALKEFLLNNVDLKLIHTFNNDKVQFGDALVSSSVVIFKNSMPSDEKIRFSWGNLLNIPSKSLYITKSHLNPNKKWNETFLTKGNEALMDTIGSFFNIKRGIATGDNNYFIISGIQKDKYDIADEFLTSVIPSPRKLNSNVYTKEQAEKDELYLFSCNLPMESVKARYQGVYGYIHHGLANEVNKRANCSHRNLWYSCEKREYAPILVSYMGRDTGDSPIRFVLNEAHATATNSYLMLYPKNEYSHHFTDANKVRNVWKILSSIPKDVLIAYGRSYGGGLLKWEPKELASIPCPYLGEILSPINLSLF